MTSLPLVEPLQRALHLRSVDLFRDLGSQQLAALARLMSERWLRAGEILHSLHHRVPAVHLLVEGSVRLEQNGKLIRRIEAPEPVGVVELLAQTEATTTVVVEANALALVIESAAVMDLIEDHFALFLQIRQALARQLQPYQPLLGNHAAWPLPAATEPGPSPATELAAQLIWMYRCPELWPFGVGVLAALVQDRGALQVPAGQTLWAAGTAPEFFVLLTEGTVHYRDESSSRFGPGALLGMAEAYAGLPHLHAAVAETAVSGIRIDVAILLDLAEDHFHVATRILAYCAGILLQLQREAAQPPESLRVAPPAAPAAAP